MPSVVLTPSAAANDSSIVFAGADEIAWDLGAAAQTHQVISFDQVDDYTQYLKLTGWNAALPASSIVDGFIFRYDASTTSEFFGVGFTPHARDLEVRMYVGGAISGNNMISGTASSQRWNALGGTRSYGSSTNKWGNTPTAAQVNHATEFGIAVAVRCNTAPSSPPALISIANAELEIFYTLPATGEAQVTLTAAIKPATATAQKDVSLVAAVSKDALANVALTAAVGPFMTLTEPDSGDTLTTAAVLFTWDTGPEVQSDYRIRVYSASTEAESALVFDTGIVGSSLGQHLAAAGQIPSGALWARGVNHDVNGMEGRTALVDFTTSFPTSVDVTGVAAVAIGGCDAPLLLPGVKVTWDEITPGGSETFVRYEVRRRKPGETAYTTIAHIEDIDELEYKDYAVVPAQVYEYAVVWVATSGAATLISAQQTTPARRGVPFDFTYLHSIADPTVFVRLEHWEALVELMQPVDVFEPWGREAGTAYTGEQFSHQIAIPLHNQQRKKPQTWEKLLALARQQRTGDVLCLRIGRDKERYFCVMRRPRKQVRQKTYEPSIELVEVGFDEAVSE